MSQGCLLCSLMRPPAAKSGKTTIISEARAAEKEVELLSRSNCQKRAPVEHSWLSSSLFPVDLSAAGTTGRWTN